MIATLLLVACGFLLMSGQRTAASRLGTWAITLAIVASVIECMIHCASPSHLRVSIREVLAALAAVVLAGVGWLLWTRRGLYEKEREADRRRDAHPRARALPPPPPDESDTE